MLLSLTSVQLAPALLASASPIPLVDVPLVTVVQVSEVAVQVAPDGEVPVEAPPEAAAPEVPPAEGEGRIIYVEGTVIDTPGDPLESLNAATYDIALSIDSAVTEPVSEVYEEDLPKPFRNALRNFLRNLIEPVNALNFMLQLKPGKAVETLGRFAINTTAGIGGLIDLAEERPFNLPYRRNGLANTLGYYGVGPGPFMVLPLIGATTLRDLVGTTVDQAIMPAVLGAPFNTPYYAVPAYTVNSLQYRMEFDDRYDAIHESVDPYMAMRENYLCLREADIADLHNRPPPRDCSIDALMAALEPEDEAYDEVLEEQAPVIEPAPAIQQAPVVPAEPIFMSVPVIQGQTAL